MKFARNWSRRTKSKLIMVVDFNCNCCDSGCIFSSVV